MPLVARVDAYIKDYHQIGKPYHTVNGDMIAAFAMMAWPAEHYNLGVMTFAVSRQGKMLGSPAMTLPSSPRDHRL